MAKTFCLFCELFQNERKRRKLKLHLRKLNGVYTRETLNVDKVQLGQKC